MPIWFLYVFAAIAVVAVLTRRLLGRRIARHKSAAPFDLLLVTVASLGLAYHCGAMFFTSNFTGALGLDGYASMINTLGTGSIVAFAVPCVLLLLGIRATPLWYIGLVAASLVAVGVTMYDGGALDAHLGAIMAAAVVIIGGVLVLTDPPRRRRGSPGGSTSAAAVTT